MRLRIEWSIIWFLRVVGGLVLIVTVTFPFYWMIIASLTPLAKLLADPTDIGIHLGDMVFTTYPEIWNVFHFSRFFANSAYVSLMTVAFTLVFATLGAYAVARLRFRGRTFLSRGILLVYMFPAIAVAIPIYVIFSKLGLRNNLNGLVLFYLAQTFPVALYMLHSYFKTLPPDLEEAGRIDGCSRLSVIWRITVPLSLPAMISVALYTFMIAWNEFLFAFLFLDSPSSYTLPRGIQAVANNVNVSQQLLMTGAVIATVPVVAVFFLFERYFIRGLTAGAVKG
ncbi:carbohydrate ABC transporter permease [Candidatus Bipolaricaulota bacterium]|nr:carbohydrate ABC transporter permease [Candidatus Bipolaricaulota bacterium]